MADNRQTFPQEIVIDNFNQLIKGLKLNIPELDKEGICEGLSYYYLYYAERNQREIFLAYLNFIASLSQQDIPKLIMKYQENNGLVVSTQFVKIEKGNKIEHNPIFQFVDVISFIINVDKVHQLQSVKAMEANWDKNFSFICKENELGDMLKKAPIVDGEKMAFSMGFHQFSLEKVPGGFYLFEPNKIINSDEMRLFNTVEEVAQEIWKNIKDANWTTFWNKNVAFVISYISWDNEITNEKNLNLNQALLILEGMYKEDKDLTYLIKQYQTGKLSAADLALTLLAREEVSKQINNEHAKIKKLLTEFIKELNLDNILNVLSEQLKHKKILNETAYHLGISLLFLACQANQIDLVKKLLATGIDPNKQIKEGESPLYIAAQNGHLEIVKALLETKIDLNKQIKDGQTALYIAAEKGHVEVVKLLLSKKNVNLHLSKNDKSSPLFIACQKGHTKIVDALLVNHADPNQKDENDATPLFIAAQNGHGDVVKKLLTEKTIDVNKAIKGGTTPLFIAVQNQHTDCINILLENGADPNLARADQLTPLFMAVQNKQLDVVEILLKQGADPNKTTARGVTPLFIAAQNGDMELVKFLLMNGANPLIEHTSGMTPFGVANQNEHMDVANILYYHTHKMSLLFHSVSMNDVNVVEQLLLAGVDPNLGNKDGTTPLFIAVKNGDTELAKMLLEKGANPNLANNTGVTPLHFAAQNGNLELVEMLLNKGANFNQSNAKGATPLFMAVLKGHDEIVKTLLLRGANANIAFMSDQKLLAKQLNISDEKVNNFIESKQKKGESSNLTITPLELAELMGNSIAIELLETNLKTTSYLVQEKKKSETPTEQPSLPNLFSPPSPKTPKK